uniref:Uncharacterized protein n=1 Tax=Aegilops tauschii subsp. strangulata TaxID=200361 RepID=A0A453RH71_AEGTS
RVKTENAPLRNQIHFPFLRSSRPRLHHELSPSPPRPPLAVGVGTPASPSSAARSKAGPPQAPPQTAGPLYFLDANLPWIGIFDKNHGATPPLFPPSSFLVL